MKHALASTAAIAVLWAGLASAAPKTGQEVYDLLFRTGTLDSVDRTTSLVYQRDVTNALKPEAAVRDTGEIALSFPEGQGPMARLEMRQDDKHRALGQFPASVGNPMIMFFYETVVRDMAEAAGGSPFYIRNRVKEALVQPSEIETGEAMIDGKSVITQTVRLYPFADDPNQDRMQGFGSLELSVTMAEDVPGWYLSLVAEALGEGATAIYRSEMTFQGLEDGQ